MASLSAGKFTALAWTGKRDRRKEIANMKNFIRFKVVLFSLKVFLWVSAFNFVLTYSTCYENPMAKQKTVYVCQNCGTQSPKWLGRCPDCSSWNSFAEENTQAAPTQTDTARGLGLGSSTELLTLDQIKVKHSDDTTPKVQTKIDEFDRVLGGGLLPGSFTLIGGDPGIGKSTLMLQTVGLLASGDKKICYISGEESVRQTQLRAQRLNVKSDHLYLGSETNLDVILSLVEKVKPFLVVIDSIQTVYLPGLQSAPGSVTQVRECAAKLMYLAKTQGICVFLVGHITKDGSIAGPKVLEHMVDTVLSFEGDNNHQFRILRSLKNRFGPVHEMGVFEMTSSGLSEVKNPSELFLSENSPQSPGSAVFCTIEGTRPFLVEVQALASRTNMAMPRRTAIGIDVNRLHLILAILDKHLRLDLYAHDIFVNVVGGLKLTEPASDLAVAASLLSSLKNATIPKKHCFFGELGLTGEVRGVSFPDLRMKEAKKMGFEKFFFPKPNEKSLKKEKTLIAGGEALDTIRELQNIISGGDFRGTRATSVAADGTSSTQNATSSARTTSKSQWPQDESF